LDSAIRFDFRPFTMGPTVDLDILAGSQPKKAAGPDTY
jgi:hypothetical protein